jgi:ectoine hydroxylase-related dioxygenase (phytanoyl-CoA dioxygenase family)
MDLNKNGFSIYNQVLTNEDIHNLKSLCMDSNYKTTKEVLLNQTKLNELVKTIGPEYVFQDYIWIIQKSSVHTCHRDNNGDFFNEGQKHPSYTMLIYLEDMDKCLGVIPESHKNKYSYFVDLTGNLVNLPCKKGDIIIFNANLIHVGTLNKRDDNLRVQLKITHKDDIDKIAYYQNFNKVLNKDNTMPMYVRKVQRNLSCMFPGFSNLTQSENIRTSRGSDNGVNVGMFQQWFSYLFYGDVNFYDLPNAF